MHWAKGVMAAMHEGGDKPAVAWPQGEVTIVVEGFVTASTQASAEDIEQHLSKLLHEGHSPSQAARMAAKALGVPRNDAYDAAVRLGKG
jgi:16S rRNA C1402 (ribose-2'-O) methylase RsmI